MSATRSSQPPDHRSRARSPASAALGYLLPGARRRAAGAARAARRRGPHRRRARLRADLRRRAARAGHAGRARAARRRASCARPSSSSASRCERNPALAREILAAGHEIGLHCDRHRNLLRLVAAAGARGHRSRACDHRGRDRRARRRSTARPTACSTRPRCASRDARGWRTLLWSHWGRDWERARDRRVDHGARHRRRRRRLGAAAARRRRLLRAGLLAAHRRGAAARPETLAERGLEPVAP